MYCFAAWYQSPTHFGYGATVFAHSFVAEAPFLGDSFSDYRLNTSPSQIASHPPLDIVGFLHSRISVPQPKDGAPFSTFLPLFVPVPELDVFGL